MGDWTSVEPENAYLLSGAYCAYSILGEIAHTIVITCAISVKICTEMRKGVHKRRVKYQTERT